MGAKELGKNGPLNGLKWALGLAVLVLAVAGNIYFEAQYSAPVRAAAVIVLVILTLLILKTTSGGEAAWKFFKEARLEMRKVVWPNRQEAMQATGLVIVVVAITAMLLWLVDSFFALIITHVII